MNTGTSIDNLRNLQGLEQQSYDMSQKLQLEQGHNAAHHSHQAQHTQYYNVPNNMDYPQFNKPMGVEQKQQYVTPQQLHMEEIKKKRRELDIEELTKDINENIPEETVLSLDTFDDGSQSGGILSFIPKEWREPLLLLVVYLLFSQQLVKQTFTNYIPQLRPDAEGKVGLFGVLIYGILIVTFYFLARKYLIN